MESAVYGNLTITVNMANVNIEYGIDQSNLDAIRQARSANNNRIYDSDGVQTEAIGLGDISLQEQDSVSSLKHSALSTTIVSFDSYCEI